MTFHETGATIITRFVFFFNIEVPRYINDMELRNFSASLCDTELFGSRAVK